MIDAARRTTSRLVTGSPSASSTSQVRSSPVGERAEVRLLAGLGAAGHDPAQLLAPVANDAARTAIRSRSSFRPTRPA